MYHTRRVLLSPSTYSFGVEDVEEVGVLVIRVGLPGKVSKILCHMDLIVLSRRIYGRLQCTYI